MIETVVEFLGQSTAGGAVAVFILSMAPGIGLSIMIPIGVSLGLPLPLAALVCILGNLAPVPIVIIFISRIFKWMRKKSQFLANIADKFEEKSRSRGESRYRRGEFWGLLIFVAVPIPFIPGTGAFTAAMIAGVLNTRMRTAVAAIVIGTVISAMFVTLAVHGLRVLLF
ncbi:MAG: small multi-drug export protein [Oscillospiraceae bacterium]|nr:small multi-drug export protein [Oscillospiraceae bacterium]